jgi:hypothetical protein
VSDSGVLFADFGLVGLWRWAAGAWLYLTALNPLAIAATPAGELYASFGSGAGLFYWRLGDPGGAGGT